MRTPASTLPKFSAPLSHGIAADHGLYAWLNCASPRWPISSDRLRLARGSVPASRQQAIELGKAIATIVRWGWSSIPRTFFKKISEFAATKPNSSVIRLETTMEVDWWSEFTKGRNGRSNRIEQSAAISELYGSLRGLGRSRYALCPWHFGQRQRRGGCRPRRLLSTLASPKFDGR